MGLFGTIDGLLGGTRYLAWGIALVCIPASLVLLVANLSLGITSAAACLAALFPAVGVTALLLPAQLAKGPLANDRLRVIGAVACVIAVAIVGVDFFLAGGMPELNLIFA